MDELPAIGMVPFWLTPERLSARLKAFNQRREITWFGLQGAFEGAQDAVVRFRTLDAGVLGGGGTAAVNGGVIAAGFDAVCVLAAQAQFDVDVVVTLTLQIQFLRLAHASLGLEFRAQVSKSTSQLCFVQAQLIDRSQAAPRVLSSALATLAATQDGPSPSA